VGQYEIYEAANVVYLQRNGDRPIGDSETVTFELPAGTRLLLDNPVLFGQVHHPMRGQVLLSINGGPDQAVHPYAYEFDDCSSTDWQSFRLPLDRELLTTGTNSFQWTVGPRPACADDSSGWDGFSVKFLQLQVDNGPPLMPGTSVLVDTLAGEDDGESAGSSAHAPCLSLLALLSVWSVFGMQWI
jgi:hypothetical protein